MQAIGTERDALDAVTARFFKGLGDVNRLKILEFLKGGEKTVGAIVEHVGLPQNQVSMHQRCLRWCGYVDTRRDGRYVLYSLGDTGFFRLSSWPTAFFRAARFISWPATLSANVTIICPT